VSNVYLLIAEEMGLIGLAAFLWVLGVYFREMGRAWSRLAPRRPLPVAGESATRQEREGSGVDEAILIGLTASVMGILVGGLLDHYFFNLSFPHSVSVFWLFLGLAMAAAGMERHGPVGEGFPPPSRGLPRLKP